MAVPFYGKPWKCSFLSINDTLLATKASLATWNGAWRLLLRESCRMRRRVWGSLNVFFRRLRDWPYSSSCSQRTSWMCVLFLSLQRDFKSGRSPGVSNGHCSNGIVIGGPHQTGNGEEPSKIKLPRRGSRSSKRQQQQQQQQQPKKFFQAKFHEQERGISLEFGKFVALISISGEWDYWASRVYFSRSPSSIKWVVNVKYPP